MGIFIELMWVLNEIIDMKVFFKLWSSILVLVVAIKIYASHREVTDSVLLGENWLALLSGATVYDSQQVREKRKSFWIKLYSESSLFSLNLLSLFGLFRWIVKYNWSRDMNIMHSILVLCYITSNQIIHCQLGITELLKSISDRLPVVYLEFLTKHQILTLLLGKSHM